MRRESARAGNALGEYPVGERTSAGEQRRFVRLQVGRRLPEVAARRRLDAVIAVAEVDGVQVGVKDLLLRVALFEPDGNRHFAHLA